MPKIFIHPLMLSTVPDSRNIVVDKRLSPCPLLYITNEKIKSVQSVLPNMVELELDSKFSVLSPTPRNFGGPALSLLFP